MYPASTLALAHGINNMRVDDQFTLDLAAHPTIGTVTSITTEHEVTTEAHPISATRSLVITKSQLKELHFSVAMLANRHIPRDHLDEHDKAITVLAVIRQWCSEEVGILKERRHREIMKVERIEKKISLGSTLIDEIPKVRDSVVGQLWSLKKLSVARDDRLFNYDPEAFKALLNTREKNYEKRRNKINDHINLFLGRCQDYGSYLETYQFVKAEAQLILGCLKIRQEEIDSMDLYEFDKQEKVDKDAQLFLFTALAILDRMNIDEMDKRAVDEYKKEKFMEKAIMLRRKEQRCRDTIASIDAIEL